MSNANSTKRTAIVTGAGSGVGRATALLLAEEGWSIALVGRTGSKLQETRRLILEQTPAAQTLILEVNLQDPAATRQIPAQVIQSLGRIDLLANIAGQAPLTTIDKITPESWAQCIDANLTCVVQLTSACWPHFQKQKSGVVVNVSSMASFDPFPGFSMYAPAKAAVNMFTHCAGMEGKRYNIKAYCIAPGAIETPMLRANWDHKAIGLDKTLDPVEVGAVIVDLALGRRELESGKTLPLPSP